MGHFFLQPPNFPYRDDIMSVNPTCLVLIILLFISIILTFKVRMKILLIAYILFNIFMYTKDVIKLQSAHYLVFEI